MHRSLRVSLLFVLVLPALTLTQERVVVGGPPPEIRTLVDSFLTALNVESADAFEAMAKAHFSKAYFAKQTPAERARLHAEIRKQFGTVSMDRVTREGPDEPLALNLKGSTGATGVIFLTMDSESPFRVGGVRVDAGARKPGGRGDRSVPAPVNGGMSAEVLGQALDAHLSRLAADGTLSGAVLVAKDGRPIFQKAYGLADRGNKIANASGTRFNLGSINKKFTEIAIAQLAGAGKLSVFDTVGKFFPDYPQHVSRAATIVQLLGHTGGIADFFGDEFARTAKDRFRANADYFALVSRLPPTFAPGERTQYCNGCYITLGAIIERVSGLPYERYVAEHIFGPAGMVNTGYPQSDGIEAGVAMGYTRRTGDGTLRSNVFAHGAAGSAAGGGYSTVADLLAFDNALREGRILSAEASTSVLGGAKVGASGRATGGMGIAGGAPGTNAVLESNGTWTVAVLTNLDPSAGENIGLGIMAALAGSKD